jgi:hypothetical protein
VEKKEDKTEEQKVLGEWGGTVNRRKGVERRRRRKKKEEVGGGDIGE